MHGTPTSQTGTLNLSQRVLLDLARHPGSSTAQISARVEIRQAIVARVISRLKEGEQVTEDQSDSPFRYQLSSAGWEWVAQHVPTAQAGPVQLDSAPPADAPEVVAPPTPATPAPNADEGKSFSPTSMRARNAEQVIQHLSQHGPALNHELCTALRLQPEQVRKALDVLRSQQRAVNLTGTKPGIYGVVGENRIHPSQKQGGRPDPAEIARRRASTAADLILLFQPGVDYTEQQLLRASQLNVSLLRAALLELQEQGQVLRLDSKGFGTRAMYRLDQLELPLPAAGAQLSVKGERIKAHLLGRYETVIALGARFGLQSQEVQNQLGILHAQRLLSWKRIGHLYLFRLRGDAA